MSYASMKTLKALARKLGYEFEQAAGVDYKITRKGEYGPHFAGTFDRCRCWITGVDFERTRVKGLSLEERAAL